MRRWIRGVIWLCVLVGLSVFRPDRALHVAAGMAAETICTATFVGGQDPAVTLQDTVKPMASVAGPFLMFDVNRAAKTAHASVLGAFGTTARFRPGRGCRIDYPDNVPSAGAGEAGADAPVPEAPAFETSNAAIRAALDHIFTDSPGEIPLQLRAVVIVKDGRIIGERYAAGIGPETPLPSYSVAKSVTNALLGILVREGKLAVSAPAPVAAWRGVGDPRGAITIEHLMRMTSGLDMAETGSGFDPVSRMLYLERDMAGYAASGALAHPPGTVWDYTSANTLVLNRILGDSIGGGEDGCVAFARQRLFAPAGMRRVTMAFDGAGTQVGSTEISAPARDWARFGQLYLDDGVARDGTRILPEGWVAWSKRPTLGASYGAGFWTNEGTADFSAMRIAAGMPKDAFFASGNRGQRIYILPSARLVVVRLGMTHREPDFGIAADLRLIREALAAVDAGKVEGVPLQ